MKKKNLLIIFFFFFFFFAKEFCGVSFAQNRNIDSPNILLKSDKPDTNKQKEKLAAAFNLWKGDLEQVDDVCIIGVKI